MDLFKTKYFTLPVYFQKNVGIWPYDSQIKQLLLSTVSFTGTLAMAVPQILGFKKYVHTNIDQTLHHVAVLLFVIIVFLKLLTSTVAKKQLKTFYGDIQKNFTDTKDKNEKKILLEHAENVRLVVLVYSVYMLGGYVLFVSLPLVPMFLDFIMPLNESRPYIYMLDGEFKVDRDRHYGIIYLFDFVTGTIVIYITIAIDTMYASCAEQCIAVFSIIRSRLLKVGEKGNNRVSDELEHFEYRQLVLTIQMHQKAISFAKVVAATYELTFLIITGMNLIYFSTLSVLLIINLSVPMNLIRFSLLLVFLAIHLFFLSWPGQKFIDSSTNLFHIAYCNQWYNCSRKTKKLLEIIFLRCLTPCQITAGGLYVMNFENYMLVMKTSISYITVFLSFR